MPPLAHQTQDQGIGLLESVPRATKKVSFLMNTSSCYDQLNGFAWGVMRAFADPLSVCRFEEGDVIHGPKHSLQVRSPRRGTAIKADEEQESAFAANWNSPAEIMLVEQKSGDSRNIRTTQGRLYCLVWKGDLNVLEGNDPPIPLLVGSLLSQLTEIASSIVASLPPTARGGFVFVTPYCTVSRRLWTKRSSIYEALAQFNAKDVGLRLDKAGLRDHGAFAPTVELSCIVCSGDVKKSVIEASLKTVLHKPNKDKKTDRDGFQLKRHGLLLEC